jgi:hypothetical protein
VLNGGGVHIRVLNPATRLNEYGRSTYFSFSNNMFFFPFVFVNITGKYITGTNFLIQEKFIL